MRHQRLRQLCPSRLCLGLSLPHSRLQFLPVLTCAQQVVGPAALGRPGPCRHEPACKTPNADYQHKLEEEGLASSE